MKQYKKDSDGGARLDVMPRVEASAALGISVAQLDLLEAMGFERYDMESNSNNCVTNQSQLATDLGITEKHVRNLEKKGLPFVGEGKSKRYPRLLADYWYAVWKHDAEQSRGTYGVDRLDPLEAKQRYLAALPLIRAYNALRAGHPLTDRSMGALNMKATELIAAKRTPPYWSW